MSSGHFVSNSARDTIYNAARALRGVELQMYGTYLWERAVIPYVPLVGEAVLDESDLAILDVLLDGIQR